MASVTQVKGKWRALVRRAGFPAQCKTFDNKARAEVWARQVEVDMDNGVVTPSVRHDATTVADVIKRYRLLRDGARPISSQTNEHYMLNRLEEADLGQTLVVRLTPDDVIGYARVRRDDGVSGYTINMEISKLSTVFRYTLPVMKIQIADVIGQARPMLTHFGLIAAGNKRDRRPTEDELARVLARLAQRGEVYAQAAKFAALSTMRRSEIARMTWSDLDESKKLLLIRDRKHPRQKKGNDQWIPLLGEAWDIVQAQPKDDEFGRIFPFHPQTLSKYFKEAIDAEGIPDLRLHDLRHEGTSRLFEQGYEIQQVAMVTGHANWSHLKRYTNLKPEDLHAGPKKKAPVKKAPKARAK